MRAICYICFLLTVAFGFAASADEAPTAKAMIELDVRVMEINATKLKALGFDFAGFRGTSALGEQLIAGSIGSGVVGFLDALDREGLVQQDVTLVQRVVDGESWETALRWSVADPNRKKSLWRTLRLRVCSTLLHTNGIRLDTACGAQVSKTPHTEPYNTEQPLVEFGAEIAHQTLCLLANVVATDPGQHSKDEIRVVVLITPHRKAELEE